MNVAKRRAKVRAASHSGQVARPGQPSSPKGLMAGSTGRYSPYVKAEVLKRYHLCRTTEDKKNLAKQLDIVDENGEGDVSKLYNLASRLKATANKNGDTPQIDDDSLKRRRLDPKTTEFSREADDYINREFGKRTAAEIAYHLKLSVPAVLVRARHLSKRRLTKHWELEDVAGWLDMSEEAIRGLQEDKVALDIYELYDRRSQRKHEVVSLTSLIRWLHTPGNREKVLEGNPDHFFLLEIDESVKLLREGAGRWENCKFLSSDHRCMNPYAENSHGLFCTNNERYEAGDDPLCSVKTFEIYDLRKTS